MLYELKPRARVVSASRIRHAVRVSSYMDPDKIWMQTDDDPEIRILLLQSPGGAPGKNFITGIPEPGDYWVRVEGKPDALYRSADFELLYMPFSA